VRRRGAYGALGLIAVVTALVLWSRLGPSPGPPPVPPPALPRGKEKTRDAGLFLVRRRGTATRRSG
jgi:hypothetical protein